MAMVTEALSRRYWVGIESEIMFKAIHKTENNTDRPRPIDDKIIPVTAIPCRVADLRPRIPITNPMIPVVIPKIPKKQGMIAISAKTVLMMPSTRLVTACPAPGSGGAATTYG